MKAKIIKAAAYPKNEWLSTGSAILDNFLGGGIPIGRQTTISGAWSTGKSALALCLIAQAQRQGWNCAFIDIERSFSPDFAAGLGVDINKLKLVIPDYAEQALEALEDFVSRQTFVVVDSLAALSARAEVEAAYEGAQISLLARLMGRVSRKITPLVAKSKSIVIWLNQLRRNIMATGYGNPYYEPGGEAMHYFRSLAIRLKHASKFYQDGKQIGLKMKLQILKNKVAPPVKDDLELELFFQGGIKTDKFEEGLASGKIRVEGRTYFVGDEKLGVGMEEAKKNYDHHTDQTD